MVARVMTTTVAEGRLLVREGDHHGYVIERTQEREGLRGLCLPCVLELKLTRCHIFVAKTVSSYQSS